MRVVETLYVSGQRKCFEPSRASLENRAVGRGIHYILAEIKPFVYAGHDKVVGFVKPQRCKAHAICRRAVHTERAYSVQIIDFFHFERIVDINGMTFAALFEFRGGNRYVTEFFRPFCDYHQAFGLYSVIVCKENFHSQPVLSCL